MFLGICFPKSLDPAHDRSGMTVDQTRKMLVGRSGHALGEVQSHVERDEKVGLTIFVKQLREANVGGLAHDIGVPQKNCANETA